MAIGCPLLGSDTEPVREFITHDETGLLVPFFEPATIAESVLRLIEDQALAKRLSTAAHGYASANLTMHKYISDYGSLIWNLTGIDPLVEPLTKRRQIR